MKSYRFRRRTICGICIGLCLFISVFLIYEIKVYGGVYLSSEIREGIRLAEQSDIARQNYLHFKEGYYCGEGGIDCDHGEGYIYYKEDLSETEAMERAGFELADENTGRIEFCCAGNYAVVRKVISYKEGKLLWYQITGAA